MRSPTILSLSLALLVASTATGQRILDTIVKTDGTSIRGVEVLTVGSENVTYKRGNDEVVMPGHDLDHVEWFEPPEAFLRGQGFLNSSDFTNATQQFADVANSSAARAPLKAEAEFLTAKTTMLASGATPSLAADAVSALSGFVSSHQGHFRVPEARLLLGKAYRNAGNTAASVAELESLRTDAIANAWNVVWGVRAQYQVAITQLAAEKATEARAALKATVAAVDGVMATAGDARAELVAIKLSAVVAEGETYLADKNYDQAATFYRGLAARPVPGRDSSLRAAAKTGLGQAVYLSAMAKDKPVGKLREAQLALAEGAVHDSAGGETTAKATYFHALCLLALGSEHESEDFRSRAMSMLDTVIKNYPDSRWAAEARTARNS